jgi:Mg-chelatase subunit ChlD
MVMNPIQRPSKRNQAGMVSILVTMIMMIVISLIVLGFAQVSRREQRQSLDRQLSTQAFFAAESGVNDVRDVISKLPAGADIPEKTVCGTQGVYTADPNIDLSRQVSYTCLLVSSRLNDIKADLDADGDSKTEPLQSAGAAIKTMHIKWLPATTPTQSAVSSKCSAGVPASANFLRNVSAGGWSCPYGVLRMDIVPTDAPLSRSNLSADQKTVFMYPTSAVGSGSQAYGTSNGTVPAMNCTAATGCNIDITNMPAGTNSYVLRLNAIYAGGTFDITATDAGGTTVELKNAQVLVDATGKAQDVLRRIQVRLPLAQAAKTPDYAVESASSVCKRFEADATNFRILGIKGQDANNPMCVPIAIGPPPPLCKANGNDIMFSIDASDSMNWPSDAGSPVSREKVLRDSVNNFINQAQVGTTTNHVGIVTWNSTANLDQVLTSNTGLLHAAVNKYKLAKWTVFSAGLNKTYDAYFTAPSNLTARAGVSRVVVFITDGGIDFGDTDQKATAAANALKAQGVIIYTIGMGGSGLSNGDLLQKIAGNGGTYTDAASTAELDKVMAQIASQVVCP